MILSLALVILIGTTSSEPDVNSADNQEQKTLGPSVEHVPDLEKYRTPFKALSERSIGSASKSLRFDWRRNTLQVAVLAGQLAEFNNFNSFRLGAMVRIPVNNVLIEVGASYIWVWDTDASQQLALTPYRQPGLPPRVELELGAVLPLAEGVVTTRAKIFPALQLVFNAYVNFRYAIVPGAYDGLNAGETAEAIFSPRLSDKEVDNLNSSRLAAMEVDRGRYGLSAGLGTDLYFRPGVFISPRVLFSVPLIELAAQSKLLFALEFDLVVGFAF